MKMSHLPCFKDLAMCVSKKYFATSLQKAVLRIS